MLITLSILFSSCNQLDGTATKEKLTTEKNPSVNAQLLEALKLAPPDAAGKSPNGTRGPVARSATEYINLSVQYYNDGEWEKCVEAGIGALNFNPASAVAYNNICIAYVQLGDYDRAILACNKALSLQPDFPRARANLNAAIKQKESD